MSIEKPTPEVIMIRERWAESLVKDLASFAVGLGMIGAGTLIGSTVLQWIGAVLFLFYMFACGARAFRENSYTISEAKAKLEDMERG